MKLKSIVGAFVTQKMIGSAVRHGMTVIGGALIAEGYGDADTWELITGGAVAAAGVGFSALKVRFSF